MSSNCLKFSLSPMKMEKNIGRQFGLLLVQVLLKNRAFINAFSYSSILEFQNTGIIECQRCKPIRD